MRNGSVCNFGCYSLAFFFAVLPGLRGENLLGSHGGFEEGEAGWTFSDTGMSSIVTEAAHDGSHGLRISDEAEKAGPAALSDRLPVTPGSGYRLSFWGRLVSGSGLGVYVRYYSAGGKKPISSQEVDLPSKQADWKHFELDTVAPENADTAEIWIHSFSPAQVVADVDEVTFEPISVSAQPPWPPAYKLTPADTSRLTEADVTGPDGLVYPNWRLAGVPGGIPQVASVVAPEFFNGLENQDISARLREAIRQAAAQGGGAIELPAGHFFLDQPVIVRESGVVVRGAGLEKTVLTFRDRLPRGEVRLFNWADTGRQIGAGGAVEIQANPKDLAALKVEAGGKVLKQASRSTEGKGWGNRFAVRLLGSDLLTQLGAGEHDLVATASYGNGEHFSKTFSVQISSDGSASVSPDQNGIFAMVGPGKTGPEILLAEDGRRGSTKIRLVPGHHLQRGDRIILEAPITERWNQLVGNTAVASHFRQYLYEIVAVDQDSITLNQPLRVEFPKVDGSFVQKAAFVERSGLEDLTIEQQPIPVDPAFKKPDSLRYWYPIEDLWMDGVNTSYAWGCWVRGVRVVNACRNPLYLTRSKFCEIRDSEAREALFKGGGGTGYVGIERSFDCLLDGVVTHNMRHAPDLQWGSAGNVVRDGKFYGSDAQWHAGWTNENLLEGNLIVSDEKDMANNNAYGYGLFSTGPSDPIHGPEGPRNVVYHNDVTSPRDGLHMKGGNEGWIIVYNRFRIGEGLAVYGKEKTFDHVIRDNTFLIGKPATLVVQFDSPNCTGIELINNAFYGPIGKISGFLNSAGALARDEGNRILPFNAEAPLPKPPVESIYEWQRSNPVKLTRLP